MPYSEFHRIIIAFVLASVRIGGAFAVCPALSDSMITGLARRVAILSFSALVVPSVMQWMPPGELSWVLLGAVTMKEAVIGFLIGYFASIPFWIGENVGNFIDNQRGATMGEVYSPLSGTQVSTTGIFFTQIISTVFFVSGAILLLLSAIYKSYDLFPMFSPWLHFNVDTPKLMLGSLDSMLATTFVIAAPVIILMFLATIGLGFVNRTAPQLNVFFLSMPIKSALGIAMLVIYLQYILDMLVYTEDSAIIAPLRQLLN